MDVAVVGASKQTKSRTWNDRARRLLDDYEE
jgi:hypothetical protein